MCLIERIMIKKENSAGDGVFDGSAAHSSNSVLFSMKATVLSNFSDLTNFLAKILAWFLISDTSAPPLKINLILPILFKLLASKP